MELLTLTPAYIYVTHPDTFVPLILRCFRIIVDDFHSCRLPITADCREEAKLLSVSIKVKVSLRLSVCLHEQ